MSKWPLALLLTTLFATPTAAAPPAWSVTADGIRARLIATPTVDAAKKPQVELWLEVENVSDTDGGIPLSWGYLGTMLQLVLEDDGKPVPAAPVAGSHASGPPYVVALPHGATLRVPVSKKPYEYQANKISFRPFTFQAWDVTAKHGKLTLRGKLTPHALDKGVKPAQRAWSKPLELPAVDLP